MEEKTYSFLQLVQRYHWNACRNLHGIQNQIHYAELRGLIIELTNAGLGVRNSALRYKILKDNTMSEKEWKIYPGDPLIEVTKDGDIRHSQNKKFYHPKPNKQGYLVFHTSRDKIKKAYFIHRVVMETFAPIENADLYYVDHIDGNRTNNTLSNLRWCSAAANALYRKDNNQKSYDLLRQLIIKAGYEKTEEILQKALDSFDLK